MTHLHSLTRTLTSILLLLALAGPAPAAAQANDAASLLAMADGAQREGHHQAAVEILVSLQGRAPAAQLAGMMAASELAMQDYRLAELAAIAALRVPSDPWVAAHRDQLTQVLAQAAQHLGEVIVDGLPAGLPVSTHDEDLGLTGQRLRLAEGPRVLTVGLPDGRRLLLTTNVVAGQTVTVDGSRATALGGAAAPAPSVAPAFPQAGQPTAPAASPFAARTAPMGSGVAPSPAAYGAPAVPAAPVPAPPAGRGAPIIPGVAAAPSAPGFASAQPANTAPTAPTGPTFEAVTPHPAPTNRFGAAVGVALEYGVQYAGQDSQTVDSDLYVVDGLDQANLSAGGALFYQHDIGERLVLNTRLGFSYHGRHSMRAWSYPSDPDFDLRLKDMHGHVSRFDVGESARVVLGRAGSWFTSYIGLGARLGVAIFRYEGTNVWHTWRDDNYYATPSSGAEVGFQTQAVLELGNYFGRERTVEFGFAVGAGKPLLSVEAHLGVNFHGW